MPSSGGPPAREVASRICHANTPIKRRVLDDPGVRLVGGRRKRRDGASTASTACAIGQTPPRAKAFSGCASAPTQPRIEECVRAINIPTCRSQGLYHLALERAIACHLEQMPPIDRLLAGHRHEPAEALCMTAGVANSPPRALLAVALRRHAAEHPVPTSGQSAYQPIGLDRIARPRLRPTMGHARLDRFPWYLATAPIKQREFSTGLLERALEIAALRHARPYPRRIDDAMITGRGV
jgi:hypothetical protein